MHQNSTRYRVGVTVTNVTRYGCESCSCHWQVRWMSTSPLAQNAHALLPLLPSLLQRSGQKIFLRMLNWRNSTRIWSHLYRRRENLLSFFRFWRKNCKTQLRKAVLSALHPFGMHMILWRNSAKRRGSSGIWACRIALETTIGMIWSTIVRTFGLSGNLMTFNRHFRTSSCATSICRIGAWK